MESRGVSSVRSSSVLRSVGSDLLVWKCCRCLTSCYHSITRPCARNPSIPVCNTTWPPALWLPWFGRGVMWWSHPECWLEIQTQLRLLPEQFEETSAFTSAGMWSTHLTRLRWLRRKLLSGSKAQSWVNGSAVTMATSISCEWKDDGPKQRENSPYLSSGHCKPKRGYGAHKPSDSCVLCIHQ